jgi:hypothetical protein
MNALWSITIDDYLEVVRLAKEAGIKEGESMESIFIKYMKDKGQKPCTNTELTKAELIQQYIEKDKKILDISINNSGETTYNIIKKKDEESGLNFD